MVRAVPVSRFVFRTNVTLTRPVLPDHSLARLVSFRLTSAVLRFNSRSRRRTGGGARSNARPALFSRATSCAASKGFPEAHQGRHKRRRFCWSKGQEEAQVIAHDGGRATRGGCRAGNVVRSSSSQVAQFGAKYWSNAASGDSQVGICKRESYF